MILAGSAVFFVLFVWWFATGAIFYLDGLPRRTFGWSIAAATLVLCAALVGLALSAREATPWGAFAACASAIGVWGWNEMLFLTGAVTGPNRLPAPAGLKGLERFKAAAASVIHHEIVILASSFAVAALTLPGPNRVGLWTFAVLWAMRLSAKLNIFVGVPNPGEGFLPPHLAYLAGHFRKAPVGLFFAATVCTAALALVLIVQFGTSEGATPFEIVGVTLIATLLALAVIEHGFLAVPWQSAALWRWSLKGRAENAPESAKSPSDKRSLRSVAAKA